MSYRELRNLCEMTRALSYPRLLSIENFRNPNFKLVAELLEWIVKRFEPNASLSADRLETEQERVMFVKQAVLMLLQNSRLKINPRKLYQADGRAVQELLPAIRLLYDASRQQPSEELQNQWNNVKNKLSTKLQEVRIARQLSTQLPQTGATLHDLLAKELYVRKQRNRATSRPIPLAEAEKSLQQSTVVIADETKEIVNKLNNVSSDEAALDEKIERRKREFDQMQKRFAKLQAFRPQYMDEFERYEAKLKELYEIYVVKFRNLVYLQQLQQEVDRSDQQKQAESERIMRQMVEKMRIETNNSPPMDTGEEAEMAPITGRAQGRRVFGNMTGAGMSDDDDDDEDDPTNDLMEVQSDLSDDHPMQSQVQVEADDHHDSSGDDF